MTEPIAPLAETCPVCKGTGWYRSIRRSQKKCPNCSQPQSPPIDFSQQSTNEESEGGGGTGPDTSKPPFVVTEYPAIGEVEKLIERLEEWGTDARDKPPISLLQEAAAMLRTLQNEANYRMVPYAELMSARGEVAALRAKLAELCDVCEAHADQARRLRAKLKRAELERELLKIENDKLRDARATLEELK